MAGCTQTGGAGASLQPTLAMNGSETTTTVTDESSSALSAALPAETTALPSMAATAGEDAATQTAMAPVMNTPAYAGGTPSESTQKLQQVAALQPTATGPAGLASSATTDYGPTIAHRADAVAFSSRDHECLARAMYFESNRSSREGMVAVGSVVMNRVRSGNWGNTVCQVVGAPQQFAPGVLTRSMDSSGAPLAMEAARSVLKGERHPRIYDQVMYFHTAGYRFGYDNMHYVAVAGGNSFYEKRRRQRGRPNTPQSAVMALASSPIRAASAAVDPVKKVLRKPVQAVKRILPISEEVEQAAAPARNAAQPAYAGEPNASRFESAF